MPDPLRPHPSVVTVAVALPLPLPPLATATPLAPPSSHRTRTRPSAPRGEVPLLPPGWRAQPATLLPLRNMRTARLH